MDAGEVLDLVLEQAIQNTCSHLIHLVSTRSWLIRQNTPVCIVSTQHAGPLTSGNTVPMADNAMHGFRLLTWEHVIKARDEAVS